MRRVGSGHLKVDAARAVGKLREYQLADRSLYLTEMARGIVAAGATEIAVSWDADDMWITWRGPALPAGPLESLFDALVSPAGVSGPLAWQRPLAVGVNTAIGLGPKHVDVHSIPEDGEAFAVRFGPRFHDAAHAAGDESGAALGERRTSDAAERVGGAGGAIHVRRRLSAETLGRFFSRAEPPEIGVLRESARWPRVAMRLDEEVVASEVELLRYPLAIARGLLAVSVSEMGHPLHLSERGFVLERLPLVADDWTRRTPVRVHVDYDRLPTNAARSQVRMDEASMRQLRHVLERTLPEFFAQWAERIDGGVEGEALRRAALEFVVGYADAGDWRSALRKIPSWASPLSTHPLAHDALGKLRPLSELSNTAVHVDTAPVDEDLAPWLGDVLWAPMGSVERVLLGRQEPESSHFLLSVAQAALSARSAWLSTLPREPRVDAAHPWVTWRFGPEQPWGPSSLDDGAMKGLSGEACLLDPAHATSGGTIALLHQGRALDRVVVDFPLPFEAVVESSALTPNAGYTGAEPDEARTHAVTGALVAALRCVELMAAKLNRPRASVPEAGAIAPDIVPPRAAMGEVFGQIAAYVKTNTRRFPWAVDGAPLLECVRGEEVSTVSLKALRADETVDTWIAPHQRYVPPNVHAVRTTEAGAAVLRGLLGRPLQPYSGGDETSDATLRGSVQQGPGVVLVATEAGRRGAIAWGEFSVRTMHGPSRVVLWHRQARLDEVSFEPLYLHCRVALDDDTIVPDRERPPIHTEWLERRMFEALLGAAEGTPPPELVFDRRSMSDAAEWLVRATASEADEARRARVLALPLLPSVDGNVSLDAIRERGTFLWGTESTLQEALEAGSTQPLLHVRHEYATIVAALTGAKAVEAMSVLVDARKKRRRATYVEKHLRGQPSPLPELGIGVVAVRGAQIEQAVLVLADAPQSFVDYRLKGRPLGRFQLASPPHLRAFVDVGVENLSENLTMNAGLQARLSRSVRYAVPRLIEQLATDAPERLLQETAGRSLLSSWLRVGTTVQPAGGKRRVAQVLEQLRRAPVWTTPVGRTVSIDDVVDAEGTLSLLAFDGEWLEPGAGESSPLDDGAIRVAHVDILRPLLEKLLGTAVNVSSTSASQLQRRRAMERGLVPSPTVRVDPRLKSSFTKLDTVPGAASMGIGEIGLTPGPGSVLRVEHGVFDLDVFPPVEIAVDPSCVSVDRGRMPNHEARIEVLTAMARELERRTLDQLDELPMWVRDNVRSSLARGAHDPDGDLLPVFPTTTGAWVSLQDLKHQREQFGDVWAVTDTQCRLVPRAPERIAVRVRPGEFDWLVAGFGAVDAIAMLRSDLAARRNLLEPRWNEPKMPPREAERRALAVRHLEGERRGVIVALHPSDHHLSGMRLARGDHPFHALPWEGEWPMWIDVSDPSLSPDTEWARPVEDATLDALVTSLRTTGEELLVEAVPPPPDDARVVLRIPQGWLALTDETTVGGVHRVVDDVTFAPCLPRLGGGEIFPPIRGAILTRRVADVAPLVADAYPQLLDALARETESDEFALAHMIYGVSIGWRPPLAAASRPLPLAPPCTLGELSARYAGATTGTTHAVTARTAASRALLRVVPRAWLRRGGLTRAEENATGRVPWEAPPVARLEPTPRERLAMQLQQLLESLGVPFGVEVGSARKRDRWLLQVTGPRMLMLSGSHPALVPWEGRTVNDVHAQRALRILAVHALGVLERAGESELARAHSTLELFR